MGADLGDGGDGGDGGGVVVPGAGDELAAGVGGEGLRDGALLRSDPSGLGDCDLALLLCDLSAEGVPDELDVAYRADVEA